MLFSQVVKDIPLLDRTGNLDTDIGGISWDSRLVRQGDLFVCLRGENWDGHLFVDEALRRGAAGLVTEKSLNLEGIPRVRVRDSRRWLGPMAANFYHHPSEKMHLVGITGTNGKTTTSYLVQSVYKAAGRKAAVMGTTGTRMKNYYRAAHMTTPEAPQIQETLSFLVKREAAAVAMEVSSHALAQHRVAGCRFYAAIFTNLTRDHLDFHGSMEEYFRSKARLFTGPPTDKPRFAILNADDSTYSPLEKKVSMPVISYGLGPGARVTVEGPVKAPAFGQSFLLKTPGGKIPVRLNLPHTFNIYNALAAAALGVAEGFPPDTIARGLEALPGVPGRLESLPVPRGCSVILDYAHTPDALEKVLAFLHRKKEGRLLVVFGCPGERDKGKRPMMGRVASRYCDLVVLTADNPAGENPADIIRDIGKGVKGTYYAFPDREEAVHFALSRGEVGDILLLAGKGHETYQVIGGERVPYSDGGAVKKYFASGQHEPEISTSPPPGSPKLQKPHPWKGGGAADKSVPGRCGPHDPSPGSPPKA